MSNKRGSTKEPCKEEKLEEISGRIKDNPYGISLLDAFDLKEDLDAHTNALRALGALLKSSHLCDFADDALHMLEPAGAVDNRASNLRWGLSQLLDLYIEKQEKILTKTIGGKNNDDLDRLYHVEHLMNLLNQTYDDIRCEGRVMEIRKGCKRLGQGDR